MPNCISPSTIIVVIWHRRRDRQASVDSVLSSVLSATPAVNTYDVKGTVDVALA